VSTSLAAIFVNDLLHELLVGAGRHLEPHGVAAQAAL